MNELFFKLLEEIDPNKLNMVYSSPNGMTVLRSSEYGFRLEQIHELKRENKELQDRINKYEKVINELREYIKINTYENIYKTKVINANDLLEILERKEE